MSSVIAKILAEQAEQRIKQVFEHLKDGEQDVDISHNTLNSVEGNLYGIVKQILKRPK